MRHRLRFLVLALALGVLLPASARAHVKLRRSDPGAGAILTSTPLQLRFWFTEPVEIAVTRVTLADASGKLLGIGDPTPSTKEQGLVELQLLTPLGAGTYTITYHTVALDGHPASGKYTFKVLGNEEAVDTAFANAAAKADRDSAAAAARVVEAEKPVDVLERTSTDPLYVVARAISFAMLVLLAGAPLFWMIVLRPSRDADPATWKEIGARIARWSALAALVFIIVGLLRLILQARLVSGNDVPDLGDITHLVARTNWGFFWVTQVVGAFLLALALLMRRFLKNAAWHIALAAAVAIALATSLSSHAGASETLRAFGVLDDSTHLLAVSAWIGGLFWLMAAALPKLDAERKSKRVSALVNGFSRGAVVSAGLVVLTGVISAWLRAGTLGALVNTSYGQAILIKLALVLCVAGIGFYNWRTVRPSLEGDGAVATLRKTARAELAISLLVVAVTAVLVALPLPGSG